MGAVAVAITLYSLSSSTMILFNKASMLALPAPCIVSALQVLATSAVVVLLWCAGLVRLHAVDGETLKRYWIYSALFVLSMNLSMRVLASTNVETLLVFRASAPILVSLIDTAVLGRAMPSPRAWASLLTIVAGAAWFLASESHFSVEGLQGMTIVTANMVLIAIIMTYGKWITQGTDVSLSMAVLLSNATSMVPVFLLGMYEGELGTLTEFEPSNEALGVLLASCAVGTAISYAGWHCRILMSATSYTLVGVLNKILTMALNLLIWKDHARWLSCVGLLICLVGGCFYEQAPPAAEPAPTPSDKEAAVGLLDAEGSPLEEKEGKGGGDEEA